MKIRGNTVGTTLSPRAALTKCENLTEEEKSQARKNIGVDDSPVLKTGSSNADRWSCGITTTERKAVTELRFVNHYTPPDGAKSWDAGVHAGEITAYMVGTVVTISANGKRRIRLEGDITQLFYMMSKLKVVKGLDMLDAHDVTALAATFAKCPELTEVDLSAWCCDSVVNTSGTFKDCTGLKRVKMPYSLKANPAAITLFSGCSSLEYADLGGLYTANSKINNNNGTTNDVYSMFYGCNNLREVVLPNISVMEAAVENDAPLFADCAKLERVTFRDGSAIENPSLFENMTTLKEIAFRGNITSIPDKTFAKCLSLEKVSGLSNVTSVGAKAFVYTPKLADIDINPAILTSIGDYAFRLSSIEDCIDMGTLNTDCTIGDYSTRSKRWSAADLNTMQNADVPTVLLRVPHADSQKNYDYVFGHIDLPHDDVNGAVDVTIAVGGCQILALYHEWQCVNRGTENEMDNFDDFWDTFFMHPEKFSTTSDDYHTDAVHAIGWTGSMKNVDDGNAIKDVIDRLNSKMPVYIRMHSVNISGSHDLLIVGSDAITGKLAVLDSNLTDKAELLWVKFEDIFTGAGDFDRLYFHSEKEE